MTIKVCVGSSCHLKGSYNVIEAFKEILKKYEPASHGSQVEETPEGFILHGVNAENAEELFANEVYPKLNLN